MTEADGKADDGQPKQQRLTRQEKDFCKKKRRELSLITRRLEVSAELKIKIILVGNSSVGKTSLIHKFVDDKADIRTTQVTMLCDFYHCLVPLTGRAVQIRIWDTGGMERFHDSNLTANFFRNSDGVLLVFSVNDLESFQNLPLWLKRVRQNVGQSAQFDCSIVGNKSDLADQRMVSRHEAERYAYQQGFTYIETSALDVVNVQKAFTDLVLAVIRRNETVQQCAAATQNSDKPLRLFRRADSVGSGSGGRANRSCGCG